MLVIYRRHVKTCKNTSRTAKNCRCPIWTQGTLGGEKVRRSLDQTSWDRATREIAEWIEAGEIGGSKQAVPSIQEAIELFLSDARARNLAPATIDLMERIFANLAEWCEAKGYRKLKQITLEVLREYRESWNLAPSTALTRIERLRGFFRFCVDSKWIPNNPAKALKAPQVNDRETQPFTEDEVKAMLEACGKLTHAGKHGWEIPKRAKAFVLLLRYTGLRISDAVTLKREKVQDGRLFLKTKKNGAPVRLPLPEKLTVALKELKNPGDYFFFSGEGKVKSAISSWDRTLRIVMKKAGIKGHAHQFRTTMATELLSEGVPVETVAAILGHSPAICLKHYAPWVKTRQDSLEVAIKKIWV